MGGFVDVVVVLIWCVGTVGLVRARASDWDELRVVTGFLLHSVDIRACAILCILFVLYLMLVLRI